MLNLRAFSTPGEIHSKAVFTQQLPTLNFATDSFLGNIGAPLYGTAGEDEEEEEHQSQGSDGEREITEVERETA